MRIRASRAVVCIFLLTASASADYVGVTTVNKVDPDIDFLCNEGNGDFVPGPLTVCNVFAGFDNPEDRLLLVGDADITASNGLYFQHPFGSGGGPSPRCAFIPAFPDLICDSFITIGIKCGPSPPGNDGTAATPDWDSGEFNFNGHVVGGWFNSDPLNGQGDAGNYPDLQVLFLQLSVPRGESSTGTISVFAKINDEVVAFFNQAVDCVAVAGCQGPEECDDGNACTDDLCDPEDPNADEFGCTHEATECNDDDACTADSCDPANGCVFEPIECDDGDACTDDACADGNCENTPVDCDDSDSCTVDECIDGECVNTSFEQTLIIKQGACPAPVNPNSNGVIPILLVGDDGFNVNNIDLDSLDLHRCDGVGGSATPLADHTKVEDLNHPADEPTACGGCTCNDDQSSDGVDDLSLKFRTSTTLAALGLGAGDGVVTLELTGEMLDGTPFCARDCVVVVPPGSGPINATMQSNVSDTFIEVTPLDLNIDSDGFADFTRTLVEGTTITLTAPITSDGRRFLRWSVNGEMQESGIRTIEVTISEDTTLKAFYKRQDRVIPELPTEGSGDMD